jgi:predicted TPR repeat methyltransferase
MVRKFLEEKIKKYYRKKWLKLLYGVLFFKGIKRNKFAESSGVLEVLGYFKFFKPQISTEFVKERFNTNANRYQKVVFNGDYHKGELASLVNEVSNLIRKRSIKNLLELGCGSGLAAERLARLDVHIVGVDLSENMISIAREKNLYDELYCSEIENFLVVQQHQKIELAFACSVIQFFDEEKLNNLFDLMRHILTDDGVFVFTFDVCPIGTRVNQKLFMEHSLQFIKTMAEKYFNQVDVKEVPFGRIEQATEVKCGLAVLSNRR